LSCHPHVISLKDNGIKCHVIWQKLRALDLIIIIFLMLL
jgi:hypothetical protein